MAEHPDAGTLPLHWGFALDCTIDELHRLTQQLSFEDEVDDQVYQHLPSLDELLRVAEGFLAEPTSLSAAQSAFFESTCQTIHCYLAPMFAAGQQIARAQFPFANIDQFVDRGSVIEHVLYEDAHRRAPNELSTVEARWFIEGYVCAWRDCLLRSPRFAISHLQLMLAYEFGDTALIPVTVGYDGTLERAEATVVVGDRKVRIWSDGNTWMVADTSTSSTPQPIEQGYLGAHLF
jgi:hypothetical protein